MGNLAGAAVSKGRLKVGSVVAYRKSTMYKGFDNSPKEMDRLTVKGIFKTHIKLEETPNINYDIDDFFDYFVIITV